MLGALLPLRISLDINKYFNETRKLRYLEFGNIKTRKVLPGFRS